MAWYVYILTCKDKSYYAGITNDVFKRVISHNTGKGSKYIINKLPVKLVYVEEFENKSQARKREIQIKGWFRLKKEKLIKGTLGK